jgi:hypothetical protein
LFSAEPDLIRHIRNATEHCRPRFDADGKKQITGLIIWDETKGRVVWEARFNIEAEKVPKLLEQKSGS